MAGSNVVVQKRNVEEVEKDEKKKKPLKFSFILNKL